MPTSTTRRGPDGQAVSYLAAVAARLAAGSITTTVEPIGGIPVLTAEEPAAGPDPATVSINPRHQSRGARGVHLHLDTRPRRQPGGHRRHHRRRSGHHPHWPDGGRASVPRRPDRAGLPGPVPGIRAGYRRRHHIVVPKGTPWFAGRSLGAIARLISDHEYQDASPHGGTATATPAPTPRATP